MDSSELLRLAAALLGRGLLDKASGLYLEVLRLSPENAEAMKGLGLVAHQRGDLPGAAQWYARARERSSLDVDLALHGGFAFQEMGEAVQAEAWFRSAVELAPGDADALFGLGTALMAQGRAGEALESFSASLALRKDAGAFNGLGTALLALGRHRDAEAAFHSALELQPEGSEARNNLGVSLKAMRRYDEAIACFQWILEREPDNATALENLGNALREAGKSGEALEAYARALEKEARPGVRLKTAMFQPVINGSNQEIDACRQRMAREIAACSKDGIRLADPYVEAGYTNFYLAYQGRDDRELQGLAARELLRACPELGYVAPHCAGTERGSTGKLKLGVASAFFRHHTIGNLNAGIIKHLSREDFEVTAIVFPGSRDRVTQSTEQGADHVLHVPDSLVSARESIADLELDILLYPEVGMDALTYYTAFSRLAPVQCATWGHPVTTGIPAMDHYLSTRAMEPDGAGAHYTEELALMERIPAYCRPPEVPPLAMDRSALGLPKDGALYMCTQSLFKVHPDFDAVLRGILAKDPDGHVVFFQGDHPEWARQLGQRFARSFPEHAERVVFLPRLPLEKFLQAQLLADVLLDTLHFSGGMTMYQAFAAGIPVVTLPGAFMRGRIALALYAAMGVLDAVAESIEDYVDKAVSVANDFQLRSRLSNRIREQSPVLFRDREAVRCLENFFRNVVR